MEHRLTRPARYEMPSASSERGAIMVEYVFLITLIAAVAAAGVILLGQEVLGLYDIVRAAFL